MYALDGPLCRPPGAPRGRYPRAGARGRPKGASVLARTSHIPWNARISDARTDRVETARLIERTGGGKGAGRRGG